MDHAPIHPPGLHGVPEGECGATATEYLFLLVLIAIVIAAGTQFYGDSLGARFSDGASSVQNAT